MSSNSLSIQCQLLSACGCSYNIVEKSYDPPQNDPFGPAIGWTSDNSSLSVIAGGLSNIDAALVGMVDINSGNGSTPSIVVAFRGTLPPGSWKGFLDWIKDFEGTPITVNGIPGTVHKGFNEDLDDILPAVLSAISSLQSANPGAPLYITGHSKGGALASLCSAFITYLYPANLQPTAVYTFASPMVGTADFVNAFTAVPVYRYENYLDTVPFLMPSDDYIDALKAAKDGLKTWELNLLIDLIQTGGDKNGAWGYLPLGTLSYITQEGLINTGGTGPNPCAPDIAAAMATGTDGFKDVLNAHSHLCSYGYMSYICPSGVCTVSGN
jgi:Lipase (class 3)